VVSAILESAAIYTAMSVCLIGMSVSGSSVMLFFLNSMPPVIGCVFSYIVIRSAMDNRRFDTTEVHSTKVVVHLEQLVHCDKEPIHEHECSNKDAESYA